MTPEQLQMIRLTFVLVMDRKMETGRLFYDRLFAVAPDTRALFRGDMDSQVQKLMDTLAMAIASLRDMPSLAAMLERLAQRHTGYGVRDGHYDKVGEALLWTLAAVLGPAFTPAVRDAWAALYGTVADVMRKAAKAGPSSEAVTRMSA
jgi:nitric oxide dioxygenase